MIDAIVNKRIVYVVTSDGTDPYPAITRVSIASIRLTNPGATISLVCDAPTDRALRESSHPLLGDVDDCISVETPEGKPVFRNRFVKTSLRQTLQGPFLYLDGDTIVREDLSPLFDMDVSLAAGPNHSRDTVAEQIWSGDRVALDEMQWRVSDSMYVNGGVLKVGDDQPAYRFFQLWHEKWRTIYATGRFYLDQPALNSALLETGIEWVPLASRYNAQIGAYPLAARDAAIWHYNFSLNIQAHSAIEKLVLETNWSGRVDLLQLEQLIRSQKIWSGEFWLRSPGTHMVGGSVRDWIRASRSGEQAVALFESMKELDRDYALRVLSKAVVDAYWGGEEAAMRLALRLLARSYPAALLRAPVRSCLLHKVRSRLRARH